MAKKFKYRVSLGYEVEAKDETEVETMIVEGFFREDYPVEYSIQEIPRLTRRKR